MVSMFARPSLEKKSLNPISHYTNQYRKQRIHSPDSEDADQCEPQCGIACVHLLKASIFTVQLRADVPD